MADLMADWYDQHVDVDTIGTPNEWGATTTVHHANVPCFIEDTDARRFGATDAETRGAATLFAPYAQRPVFTPGSSVVMPDGRVCVVVSVAAVDSLADDDLDGITVQLA